MTQTWFVGERSEVGTGSARTKSGEEMSEAAKGSVRRAQCMKAGRVLTRCVEPWYTVGAVFAPAKEASGAMRTDIASSLVCTIDTSGVEIDGKQEEQGPRGSDGVVSKAGEGGTGGERRTV